MPAGQREVSNHQRSPVLLAEVHQLSWLAAVSGPPSARSQRPQGFITDGPVGPATSFQCFISFSFGSEPVEEPGMLLPVSQMRKLRLKVKARK